MLTTQFIEQNLHFAISLFAGLVFFAVFWLYFDAWLAESTKSRPDTFKWVGFLLVAVSFVPYATLIEQQSLGNSIFGDTGSIIANVLRILGYIAIVVGQVLDPLQEKPKLAGLDEVFANDHDGPAATKSHAATKAALVGSSNGFGSVFLLPLAALAIAGLYLRRATVGLERHLRPVAIAFFFLFAFELLSDAALLRGTSNPTLFNAVKAFGPIWVAAHLFLLAAAITLGRWVWHYLTERFLSQLFMTFTAVVLTVFVITTVSFTFLLLRNIEDNTLNNLSTATSVLNYAFASKKSATEANSEAIAASPAIAQAIAAKDHNALHTLTNTFLETKQEASLVITNADGQVLLRAEDPDRWGDSISSDTLFRRAAIGTSSSTVDIQPSVLAPVVSIRSMVPARDAAGNIVGSVSVSTHIDNAFLDGIKRATGLDAAIYSGNIRSATTFTAPDGISRWVGVKETNPAVTDAVLTHGQIYRGQLSVLNRDYLAVYAPLKDADNTTIGMIFIGETAVAVLKTTTYLISLTFIVSAVLLVASIIPAYIVARYISRQLQ